MPAEAGKVCDWVVNQLTEKKRLYLEAIEEAEKRVNKKIIERMNELTKKTERKETRRERRMRKTIAMMINKNQPNQ